MTQKAKVGQKFKHHRLGDVEIVHIHRAGTIDVKNIHTKRHYRISGLPVDVMLRANSTVM